MRLCCIALVQSKYIPQEGWQKVTGLAEGHRAGSRTQGWQQDTGLAAGHGAGSRTRGWQQDTGLAAGHGAGSRTQGWQQDTGLAAQHRAGSRTQGWQQRALQNEQGVNGWPFCTVTLNCRSVVTKKGRQFHACTLNPIDFE